MLETIITSAFVAVIVSKAMAFYYLRKIDSYTDDLLETVKVFLKELATMLSKRT